MSKKQILSKLNKPDYNNILEEVLENKDFTADTKNLLLSMLYKIETSYKDYSKVKRTVLNKNDFIEQIIATIKYCCEKISLVEPNSEIGKKMKGRISKIEKKDIIALPTEYALLSGVVDRIPLDFKVDTILKEEILDILYNGYKASSKEVIYDFDGWTWNPTSISETILLYKNIEILIGIDSIEQWKRGEISFDEVQEKLFEQYDGEIYQVFMAELSRIVAKAYIVNYNEKAESYMQKLKEFRKEWRKINNTTEYINDISNKKKELNKRIKEIEKLLLNSDLLKETYTNENAKRPLEKKIFSMRHYGELLKKERSEIIEKINEYSKAIQPKTCMKKKEYIKAEIDKYEIIESAMNEPRTFYNLVIDFQDTFLKMLEVKVERAATKKELINLIYVLRYYKYIKLDDYIKNIKQVQNSIDILERKLLLKAANSGVFTNVSEKQLINVAILQKILDTPIIDMEDIGVLAKAGKERITIEIYDGEILENTIELDKEIKVIQIKENKKIKLFN